MLKYLIVICIVLCTCCNAQDLTATPPGCKLLDDNNGRRMECSITQLPDCTKLPNLLYSHLFCYEIFNAVSTIAQGINTKILKKAETTLSSALEAFTFVQYLPDNAIKQSSTSCMDTLFPVINAGSTMKLGGGLPLCQLIASVASFSEAPLNPPFSDPANPVGAEKAYGRYYYDLLFSTRAKLSQFKSGSSWDGLVKKLGTTAARGFKEAYSFATGKTYNPEDLYNPWPTSETDKELFKSLYNGISGGGGSGWGNQLGIGKKVLLQFGGGGGGGYTSYKKSSSGGKLGAGGGGGINFGNAYEYNGVNYNGLGLGAGTSYAERNKRVQYSYYPAGVEPDPKDKFVYQPEIIRQFDVQLANLKTMLRTAYKNGQSVKYEGGGELGSGLEYLKEDGSEYVPHAVSQQSAFYFTYNFKKPVKSSKRAAAAKKPKPGSQQFYKDLSKFQSDAREEAMKKCGGGYTDYKCVCETSAKITVRKVEKKYGKKAVPDWLKNQNCG